MTFKALHLKLDTWNILERGETLMPDISKEINTWVVQKLIRMGLYAKVTNFIATTFTPK